MHMESKCRDTLHWFLSRQFKIQIDIIFAAYFNKGFRRNYVDDKSKPSTSLESILKIEVKRPDQIAVGA